MAGREPPAPPPRKAPDEHTHPEQHPGHRTVHRRPHPPRAPLRHLRLGDRRDPARAQRPGRTGAPALLRTLRRTRPQLHPPPARRHQPALRQPGRGHRRHRTRPEPAAGRMPPGRRPRGQPARPGPVEGPGPHPGNGVGTRTGRLPRHPGRPERRSPVLGPADDLQRPHRARQPRPGPRRRPRQTADTVAARPRADPHRTARLLRRRPPLTPAVGAAVTAAPTPRPRPSPRRRTTSGAVTPPHSERKPTLATDTVPLPQGWSVEFRSAAGISTLTLADEDGEQREVGFCKTQPPAGRLVARSLEEIGDPQLRESAEELLHSHYR